MKGLLRQLDRDISALEREIRRLDPEEGEWTFFFQLLRSYDRFHLVCYRETLLFAIVPQYLLEGPYRVEEYVDPPRAYCGTKADFIRYSEPDWLELSDSALTDRLPRSEFGYLHPSDQRAFLGISQQTYDRLYALYRRCPAQCREAADRALLDMIDFILDKLDQKTER